MDKEELEKCKDIEYFAEKYIFKRPLKDVEKLLLQSFKEGKEIQWINGKNVSIFYIEKDESNKS
jgi:hypothetical protein